MTCQRRSRKHPAFTEKVKTGQLRNAEWTALSKDQKIASLRKRAGESKRQLKKLGIYEVINGLGQEIKP